jgi:hypothetical protein
MNEKMKISTPAPRMAQSSGLTFFGSNCCEPPDDCPH